MKNSIALLSAVISSIFLCSTSYASTTWIRCDTCDVSSAQSYSSANGPLGAVVVYNLAAGSAFRFYNDTQMIGENCQPNSIQPINSKTELNRSVGCHSQVVAIPEPLSSEDLPLKGALVDFYNATEGTLQAKVQFQAESILPGPGPVTGANGGSSYDFVNNAIYRAQMDSAARAAASSLAELATWNNLREVISAGAAVHLLGMDGSQIKVKILYPDGSQTVIIFDKDMDVVSRESLSAEGLSIVTAGTISEFIGQITFNNEQSLQNFFDTLNFLNVPVSGSYYQMPQTGSCHAIPNGVSCTKPK